MGAPVFIIKIYREGIQKPCSVEFHSVQSPRVVDLSNEENEFELEVHKEFIKKGATHAVDVFVNDKVDYLYIMRKDVMFIESPHGETIFSVNRKS